MRGFDLFIVLLVFGILCAVYLYDRWVRRTDRKDQP